MIVFCSSRRHVQSVLRYECRRQVNSTHISMTLWVPGNELERFIPFIPKLKKYILPIILLYKWGIVTCSELWIPFGQGLARTPTMCQSEISRLYRFIELATSDYPAISAGRFYFGFPTICSEPKRKGGYPRNTFKWGCAARSWKPLPYFRAKYSILQPYFRPDSQNVYPVPDPVICCHFDNSQ